MTRPNLPNSLTLLRILMVPAVVVALLEETTAGDVIAAVLFALAAITDGVDGYIARRRDIVTTFGKLMDPIADKMLVAGTLISLVALERLSVWVAIIIIAREFAVSSLRMVISEHGKVISASWLGKFKTVIQIAAVLIVIIADPATWVDIVVWAMVAITLISGIDYFMNVSKRIDEDPDEAVFHDDAEVQRGLHDRS